jgi:flavin reductase (DIM6/NTAB) family NADH-FMN oxidoreductase RutF
MLTGIARRGVTPIAAAANANIRREGPRPADDSFRLAMRQLASGVSIITRGEGTARIGFTATSVSPLSADPPTLVVCLDRASTVYPGLAIGERFGLSVLAAGQAEFADCFAGRSGLKDAGRFEEGRWLTTPGGASVLAEAAAIFECDVEDVIERHTHAIVIGRVRLAAAGAPGGALVRWRGGYDQIGWSAEEISRAIGLTPTDR